MINLKTCYSFHKFLFSYLSSGKTLFKTIPTSAANAKPETEIVPQIVISPIAIPKTNIKAAMT